MAKKQSTNPEKFFKKFGARVKQLRLDRDWTQEDMFSLGFSYRFYQRIEAGKPIHMRTVLKLADAFGIPVKELLSDL